MNERECSDCQPYVDVIAKAWSPMGDKLQQEAVLENIKLIRTGLESRGMCHGICNLINNWFNRESDKTQPHEG